MNCNISHNVKHHIWTTLLFLLSDLLCAVKSELRTLKETEGNTVTLNPHLTQEKRDSDILWLFRHESSDTVIAVRFKGQIETDYIDRFRDRLQLDRQTGSLTISNLTTSDSGVYHIQGSLVKFNLTIYSPVCKPVIKNITQSPSVSQRRSVSTPVVSKRCSVLCSVENGREVTLSWQSEGEILNHTSSPDLNTNLSLPLEIEEYNSTYSCVAANPASIETVPLNTEELCPKDPDPPPRNYLLPAVLIPLVLIGIVIGSVILLIQLKNKKHKDDENEGAEGGEVNYAELHKRSKRAQQPSEGALCGLESETEDRTVYADVCT
ncbi:hypothetical protein AGOR_G00192050 [Albula goreensis]|uniref:Ig-like domain-containing protein n=1 Tax=Albula goreensis TaxID=1534307 RepID=A0A8T3CTC1_9TELE|nr:hypothetical protein AGOR_G00192050 [Albula goreensis]